MWKIASVIFAVVLIANNVHEFDHLLGALAIAGAAIYLAWKEGPV